MEKYKRKVYDLGDIMEKFIVFLLLILFSFPFFIPFFIEKIDVPVIYQLTNIDLNKITTYYRPKYLIIDYSKNGSEKNKFSHWDISRIKSKDIIPLAYLSIGEAEDYRFYWNEKWYYDPPEWLDAENPKWEGNYKVKYWYKEWKNIIFSYLDKIISQGFSGVYLDLIDSYIYWADNGYNIKMTASEMIDFVLEIAEYARKKNPNFLIVPQNAEEILEYDDKGEYIKNISGIGVESLFYKKNRKRSDKYISNRLRYILRIKDAGKFVLVTDYVYNPQKINEDNIKDFIKLCEKYGFYGYPANTNQKLDDISGALKYYKVEEVKK
ncbi:MJ1477/TM1410 family putative glycoside hydrolase [Marinitoga lauensis]|uniref:MJ1477/TM1410 family putative glycoside hydrolase n=1 Tax=Marinitoga lauensis TaxID=2201189 RepID=UPI001980D81D|nr:MJ1477/TM1410 family putative glycoside hydrolase [Marinitoga lauensis]